MTRLLDPAGYAFNPHAVPLAIVTLAIFWLAVSVLVRERASRVSRVFALMTLFGSVWFFAFSWMTCATDPAVALTWAKLAYLGIPFIPAAVYHFAVTVVQTPIRRRWVVWLNWALAVGFAGWIIGTDDVIRAVQRHWWGYYPQYTSRSVAFLVYFFVVFAASLWHYWREYRRLAPGTARRRISWLLAAFTVAALASVDFLAKFRVPIYPIGYVPVLAFVVMTAHAIRRYRLVDITPAFAAQQILETMADGLLVLDEEGTVRITNPAACRLFRQPADRLVGQSVINLVDHVTRETFRGWWQAEEAIYEEWRLSKRAGADRLVGLSTSVVRDGERRPLAVVCTLQDLSERVRSLRLAQSNAALQQEIERRLHVERRMEASLREKEVLLREVHHRVKNNLQVVSSLLSLESDLVSDPQVLELFRDSQQRIRSMAIVHEQLYRSTDLASIRMDEYVGRLVESLCRSYGATPSIGVRVDVEPVTVGIDIAVPCGLLVNELVTNALKHAFPSGRTGNLTVSVRRLPTGQLHLRVVDTGVGLPATIDIEHTKSLGWRLIGALSQQLSGSIEVDRARGTAVSVTFNEVGKTRDRLASPTASVDEPPRPMSTVT